MNTKSLVSNIVLIAGAVLFFVFMAMPYFGVSAYDSLQLLSLIGGDAMTSIYMILNLVALIGAILLAIVVVLTTLQNFGVLKSSKVNFGKILKILSIVMVAVVAVMFVILLIQAEFNFELIFRAGWGLFANLLVVIAMLIASIQLKKAK